MQNINKNLFLKLFIAFYFLFSSTTFAAHEPLQLSQEKAAALDEAEPLSPIIITHGFLGKHFGWYKEGGDFFEAIQASNPGHEVHAFSWNQPRGGMLTREHLQAAFDLASFIWNLQKPVILIAHSYGGLVAFLASQFLYEFQDKYNTGTYLIKSLYTLGTPHNPNNPQPNMHTIKHLYNIYSPGDWVANFFAGSGDLPQPLQKPGRTTNLLIKFDRASLKFFNRLHPSHEGLHSPLIGHHLLTIPHLIKNEEIEGVLTLHHDKEPIFTPGMPPKNTIRNWIKNKLCKKKIAK